MSSQPSIAVDNLTKEFAVAHDRAMTLKSASIRLFRRMRAPTERFRALDGISFEVAEGECIGVVGENGSGKSTLLGVLSRILRPTSGSVMVRGRVCTLLELGAGFHPELTGVENIYLNGIILGLSRAEVAERVESIIEFAEIADFVDAPVRTYSSGMVMRLGFSVAVHVDPDVLLVDEVLAVGDEHFNRKCYARMDEFRAREDRTLVLVSHDLNAVRRTCDRVLWLDQGRIAGSGETGETLERYIEHVAQG